ncbi:zinc carboxypeptidase [Xylariaceae sp. FL1272]|nr:zinc carboxypeptidase [Xylariaceae sp. FL1272]
MRVLHVSLLALPLVVNGDPVNLVNLQLDRRSYKGYKLFRVTPENDTSITPSLQSLAAIEVSNTLGGTGRLVVDVAIPPCHIGAFNTLGLVTETLSEDLGADIALEGELKPFPGFELDPLNAAAKAALPKASWFGDYHPYADHLTFLNGLQEAFPSNSELITAGTSFENRSIQGIHIWGSGKDSKPAIIVSTESDTVGREPLISSLLYHRISTEMSMRENGITSMTVEYIAYQLIETYRRDPIVQEVLDNHDFYIFPIVNPDGFVYSQIKDRFWRKNRQTRSGETDVGTDLNRNWPYQWDVKGSSNHSGSVIVEKHLGIRQRFRLFDVSSTFPNNTHTLTDASACPYAYSCTAEPTNQSKQDSLAKSMSAAIAKVHGTKFRAGRLCPTLYGAAGCSSDYFTDVAGAEYAWGIELRGPQFTVPSTQILPSGEEIWAGLKDLWANF